MRRPHARQAVWPWGRGVPYSGASDQSEIVQDDPLAPLLAPLSSLRGVGPASAEKLERLTGGGRIRDLLFHLPESFVDRRTQASLRDTVPGQVVTWAIEIAGHEPASRPAQPWRVRVKDATGAGELAIWEKTRLAALLRAGPGTVLVVSGRVDEFGSRLSMRDPAYAVPPAEAHLIPPVDPVWPMTAKLSQRELRTAMRQAIERVPELDEWHDPALLRRERWPSFRTALLALQSPAEPPDPLNRSRLAYDEMLAHQLAMAWMKAREKTRPGRALTGDGHLREQALARFGFAPTASQAKALAEIDADLAAPRRMLRLLQGDVGSGKTLVRAAGDAARGGGRGAGGAHGADRGAGQAASAHARTPGALPGRATDRGR